MNKKIETDISLQLFSISQKLPEMSDRKKLHVFDTLVKLNENIDGAEIIPLPREDVSGIMQAYFSEHPHAYIVIMGFSRITKDQILRIAQNYGFPEANTRVEIPEGDGKQLPFQICGNELCQAVLVGTVKHKAKKSGKHNPIVELKELCSVVHELRSSGALKITGANLRIGLEKVASTLAKKIHIASKKVKTS